MTEKNQPSGCMFDSMTALCREHGGRWNPPEKVCPNAKRAHRLEAKIQKLQQKRDRMRLMWRPL